jgi:hypothetical protein
MKKLDYHTMTDAEIAAAANQLGLVIHDYEEFYDVASDDFYSELNEEYTRHTDELVRRGWSADKISDTIYHP